MPNVRRLIVALLGCLALLAAAPVWHGCAAQEMDEQQAREQQEREKQVREQQEREQKKREQEAREQKMREQQVVDGMIIEFLKNLLQLIKLGDLSDVEALEEILGVEAVVDGVEKNAEEKETRYYLMTPKSKVLSQHKSGHHEYRVIQPLRGKASSEKGSARARVDLKLVFSPSETERGIAVAQMESVFGKRQFHREHEAYQSSNEGFLNEEHVYRWEGRNDIWAMFLFDAETRFLVNVKVYQR